MTRLAMHAALACCVLSQTPAAADVVPSELVTGRRMEVHLDADARIEYKVSLPAGTSTRLDMTQIHGFADLELHDGTGVVLTVRTEAGVEGHIEAPLLASQSQTWRVIVTARHGKGEATIGLGLSDLHSAVPLDTTVAEAFEHYVRAEQLRRENYRETVVTQRGAATDDRTRAAFMAAEAGYLAAGDGCGVRRARIGLSRMEVALGNHAAARVTAETALTAECVGDLAEQAQALKTLGMAAAYQGDFAASADAAERALVLYEETGDRRYQGIVLGNLSEVYMQLGATDRALAAATRALDAAAATADGQGIVFNRKSIADIHLARGELAAALDGYRRMLTDLDATPYPMLEGETWNALGIVYHRMADYQESLKAFAKAGKIWTTMQNRVGASDTLVNRAETLLELKQTGRAIFDFHSALKLARSGGLKSTETRALRGLGLAALAQRRMETARKYLVASREVARVTGEIAAESYAMRALAEADFIQGRSHDARHNDGVALELVRKAGDRDGEAATLVQAARHLAAAGELDAARTYVDEAFAIVEAQRGQINDRSLRTSYFASMRAFPDAEIDILMRLDARFPGQHHASDALAVAERARARTLQDMFVERSIDAAHFPPSESGEAEQGADSRIAAFVRPPVLDLGEVQRMLRERGSAVVEYWLGARESYVWVVTGTSFRAVRLPNRARISQSANRLSALLRTSMDRTGGKSFEALSADAARHLQVVDEASANLAALLLGSDVLRGVPRPLTVVADAELMDLPFGVLTSVADARAGIEHDVSYLPSITTLRWLQRSGRDTARPVSLAVFAAPSFDSPAGSARAADSLPPLPHSRAEAEAIAGYLPKARVLLAEGADASREQVLSINWRNYSIVHFATHAVVDRRRPEMSGIVLSHYDSAGRPEDGVLRMSDIYNLHMPVDLVVLSGCDTASGRVVDSEGVLSLSRAFLFAGARAVIASLWPVEDRATAAFMREFYRALLIEHRPAAAALRFAQQRLAQDGRWASPYYWAGFVLQGDWRPGAAR